MFTWMGFVRSAGFAIGPRVIVKHHYLENHTGAGIIIGIRPVRVQFETGATYDMTAFGGYGSWWLPIKLPCTHCPTPRAHNHVELKQSISMSMADVVGRSSSRSVDEDDLNSGQQGGSSADPGVDTIESFLPHSMCSLV